MAYHTMMPSILWLVNNNAAAGNLIPLKQKTGKVNNKTITQFELLVTSET
jgi:hypothetical protein